VESWINLIKQVKSSDVEEITAAYNQALPFVVQDWAKMILKLAKSKRLTEYTVTRSARWCETKLPRNTFRFLKRPHPSDPQHTTQNNP
jgi:hypothetical protein